MRLHLELIVVDGFDDAVLRPTYKWGQDKGLLLV